MSALWLVNEANHTATNLSHALDIWAGQDYSVSAGKPNSFAVFAHLPTPTGIKDITTLCSFQRLEDAESLFHAIIHVMSQGGGVVYAEPIQR
jgi:hypothetical protein